MFTFPRPLFRAAATAIVAVGLVAGPATSAEAASPKPEKIIKVAKAQKGKPYRYGAAGPKTFDCSGYVQYVMKKSGKKIGRTSGAQLNLRHVKKNKKRPGDVLIFIKNGRAYHSAIYAGKGTMWEAQRTGTRVGKHKIWSSGYVVRRA